ANERAFAVQRAAPPHVAVSELAGKGWVGPAGFGGFVGGDDVLMRGETDGVESGVGAVPGEEQGAVIDQLKVQFLVQLWIKRAQQVVQVAERSRVGQRGVLVGDGAALYCQANALGNRFAVNIQERERFGGFAFDREAERADNDD